MTLRMKVVMSWLAAALGVACTRPAAAVTEEVLGSVALTIYSSAQPGAIPAAVYRPVPQRQPGYYRPQAEIPGFAVVKQERDLTLSKGRSTVRFTDVAALIDPTTVSFTSLSDPDGTRVLEQNYQFDLVSTASLLERYLDRSITVEQAHGDTVQTSSGTLTSTAGGLILTDAGGGVQIINSYSNVRLPELPGGLISKPTLVWEIDAKKAGAQQTRVTYQTDGIAWWADYNAVFSEGQDANSGRLDLGAWVSIINQSGATYADAKLKLIAGDVHRAPRPVPFAAAGYMRKSRADSVAETGFEEKSFFEYHLYTLGRQTTLPDNSTKQLELFPAAHDVPCEKVLVYYGLPAGFRGFLPHPMFDRDLGSDANTKVDVYLRFKNAKENNLGMPLPSGRVRVSKLDAADKTLEFVGEDSIDHTPKDEKVLVKLGNAFDVVGERTQTDFKLAPDRKWMEEEVEIKLRNHKTEPVTVIVKENLFRWLNWEITEKTRDYEKVDARTIHFPVEVKPDGETIVRYRVRYTGLVAD